MALVWVQGWLEILSTQVKLDILGGILCLAIDISCRALFTGSSDQTIRKWDVITGEYCQSLKGHAASVTQLGKIFHY